MREKLLSGVNVCWTEFNFKKWIYLYSFLSERCIDSCWFLDSDVLLVDSLDSLEKSTSLSSVDWTFWNTLHQQQGWIRSRLVVREFIEHFLDIFSDKSRLSSIEYSLFADNPNAGFTLMRAWDSFYLEHKFKASSINDLVSTSPPLIFVVDSSRNASYNVVNSNCYGGSRSVAKLFLDNNLLIYTQDSVTRRFNPATFLDLSWLDQDLFWCLRIIHSLAFARQFEGLRSVDDLPIFLFLYRLIRIFARLKTFFDRLQF